ncbi:MAG: esterase [Lachnospiraceae bacterium]|nr:esterase [Lachnospiraceae bacterium]
MVKTEEVIGGKNCIICSGSSIEAVLIQPIAQEDEEWLEEELSYIRKSAGDNFLLAAFVVKDWNGELSPWKSVPVFKGGDFAGGADETLNFVVRELLPHIYGKFGLSSDVKRIMGGYSLAGLFSLYCAYWTDHFAAVAAASPSVWFPGWIDYVRENRALTRVVYLSLGETEELTKNQTMSKVGDNIREMADIYAHSAAIKAVKLEWNEGNHFTDPDIRTAKGFAWALKNI